MALQMTCDVKEASGLHAPPWPRGGPDRRATDAALGTLGERQNFGHGYDVDVVVGASYEFRRTVCAHSTVVGRGEAQHILRALLAAGWAPPDTPCCDCGKADTVTPDDRLCDVCAADRYVAALSDADPRELTMPEPMVTQTRTSGGA